MKYEIWKSRTINRYFYLYDKKDNSFGSIADSWSKCFDYIYLIQMDYEYLQEFNGDEKEFLELCHKLTGKK